MSVGLDESSREAVLSHVLAARLTSDGNYVVALDDAPPFVKVYDRRGTLQKAFLGQGGGPLEMQFPSTLAVGGDGTILVASAERRLSLFDLSGEPRQQATGIGFHPLSAISACDGEWLVYGPQLPGETRETQTSAGASWLHRVRFLSDSAAPEIQGLMPDSVPSGPISFGIGYGMVATGDSVLLRHDFGNVPVLARWVCGASSATSAAIPGAVRRPPAPVGAPQEGRRTVRVQAGSRVQAGIAAVVGGTVLADFLAGGPGGTPDRTLFTLVRGDQTRSVSVDGIYRIHDSRPGVGVLLGATEPAPHVFLLSEADFLGMFGP